MSEASSSSTSQKHQSELDQSLIETVEELQLSLEELATSLVELYQVVSPLAQQTQELTTAISEHTDFIIAWQEFFRKGAEQREKPMESN